MSRPSVIVVGGGLAGIAAALACADAGAEVALFEGRPWLGGATWSTVRDGLEIDNGQHVFLRCCTAYLDWLRRIDALDRVEIQPRLAVPVAAPGRPLAWIRRHRLPRPAHLAPSLLRFAPLAWRDRLLAARAARALGALDLDDPALDAQALGPWLAARGASPRAIDAFWDLLIRPTLNLPAREASLALAAKVFQTGLLGEASAGDVGWAAVPLREAHGEPAARALRAAGVRLALRSPVDRLESGRRPALRVAGERLEADAVILAVPHEAAAALLPPASGLDPMRLRGLGRAPIANLHVVFDRPVLAQPFVAALDSPLQWIFDRSRAAGLARGQYLAVSLSAADEWMGRSRAELRSVFLPAFAALLPAARSARVERFLVTCEPAATFRQGPGTRRWRPGAATRLPGLYVAGAWTDTGWPATMEGAVRSGLAAARAALRDAGRERALPAAAA